MEIIFDQVYLIPLLPLVGFLIVGLGRNELSKNLSGIIASGFVLISFLLSAFVFYFTTREDFSPVNIQYFDFIHFGDISIPFGFFIDQLTALFLLIITGVGFLIHVYSTSYMHDETPSGFGRYFSYLNLFVFSMLILVMGSNYVVMFIGWEGVGLCSYLLIGFWFRNNNYTDAAKKAFIMNRIGDVGFLLGIFWLLSLTGTISYQELFGGDNNAARDLFLNNKGAITGITLLFFFGATGKSAQIPLYTWLPDAMAGPTPVSALIHAATMVTAGIYMIARSNILYSLAPVTMMVVAIVGLSTAILAAIIALRQNDIKKVLAYSTVSQLGYMFLGLGAGAYTAAVFHVMTHAFFKALLFLGAGSVIHAMGGEQDIMKMGGLSKKMKTTYVTFFIACLAIAGIPPFSGFFSKDEILSAAYLANPIFYVLGLGGALLTAFYMFRLLALTFAGGFRGKDETLHHVHESPRAITIPLIILAILSAVGGLVGIPELFLDNGHRLAYYLSPVFAQSHSLLSEHHIPVQTEFILLGVSVVLIVAVSIWAWSKYSNFDRESKTESSFSKLIRNKFYVDELYNTIVVKPLKTLSFVFSNVIEKSGIDGLVNGVGRSVTNTSRQIRLLQTGQVGAYIFMMVLGILVLFIIQMFSN